MKMNLKHDLINEIQTVFAENGIRYKPHKDFDKYLVDYLTFNKKMIYPVPRLVEISSNLMAKLDSHPKRKEIEHIISLLKNGNNINHLQSNRLLQLGFHDHMLYEWNIHHVHLSPLDKANKKTNSLLFMYVDKTQVLLLDIDTHRKNVFADEKWLEIIYDNWYHIMNQWETKNIVDISPIVNAEERQLLWDKGLNLGMVKIKSRIFHNPGLGRMSSGHSTEVMMATNNVFRWLIQVEEELIKKEKELKVKFFRLPLFDPDLFSIKAKITTEGIVIYEPQTNFPFYTYK
ncbi:MAG: hypothetical protein JWO92_1219 [Chitinophagaceae bacterium]|nr:hypothetical protein [Chitinophagaceae bacterium]